MYNIYHIPGKKIGVTRNLNKRVTEQQGYGPGEYEVLFTSDDIDFISSKEIELQKSYGYKVDRKLYKNLFNKMKINATEQTSTFPCPANEAEIKTVIPLSINAKKNIQNQRIGFEKLGVVFFFFAIIIAYLLRGSTLKPTSITPSRIATPLGFPLSRMACCICTV